jgi:hypothetical protein
VLIAEYGYFDIVIDDNGFVLIPGEYEHCFFHPWFKITMPDRRVFGYPRTGIDIVGCGLHSLQKGSFRTIAVIFG